MSYSFSYLHSSRAIFSAEKLGWLTGVLLTFNDDASSWLLSEELIKESLPP